MQRSHVVALVVLVALGSALAFTWRVLTAAETSERSAQGLLARADRAFGVGQRLLQREQFSAAEGLARGDLAAYLGAIQSHQDALFELQSELDRAVPGERPEDHLAQREALVAKKPELIEAITADAVLRLERFLGDAAWRGRTRAELTTQIRRDLLHCAALGASACLAHFAHRALHDRVEALRAKLAQGSATYAPDIALVVDASGNGLADADNPAWPDAKAFASYVPALSEALASGAIVRDVARLPGRESWYLVAAAPILEGRETRGAVLVATRLGADRARTDADYIGLDVAWIVAGDVVASTMGAVDEAALGVALAESGDASRHQFLLSDRFRLAIVPLTGYVSASDVRVALLDQPQRETTALTLAWGWAATVLSVLLALAWVFLRLRASTPREPDLDADLLAAMRRPQETWSSAPPDANQNRRT